ncbi:hypothetical protein FB45DRAFT_1041793 [Roridomyces roridus]|uniref:Uncharacterized protein n=1 Tax=Roridomyces roridus TaxID=1738132 RepID=A0AAD7F9Q3_9AGAR|nr:hypothetical protein FB45DRAFT_1041793 [Roridomyces roridus]
MPTKKKFPKPKPKLRIPLTLSAPSPPRNSFTQTDYYRTTREEIHSPVSRLESLSPTSPYASRSDPSLPGHGYSVDYQVSPTRLTYIQEGTETDVKPEEAEYSPRRVDKPSAFWAALRSAIFRKRRGSQKN